jgi:diketogulonate reductase-like aldo/keto reductase
MTPGAPTHTLNDGSTLPAIGFGTYPLTGEEGIQAMVSALENGYRYLDSAVNYHNEEEVGEALRRSGVPREDVQLATKVPGRFHAKELALQSLRDSAKRFGVERLDVALIHWPNPSRGLYRQAWQALVEAQRDGLVRTIGVSNFTKGHLRDVIEDTGVTPAVNQVELHPYFPQADLRAVHHQLGTLTQAWSPLGKNPTPFHEAAVGDAARAHAVSPAQVVLRWHLQLGTMPLPKSAHPQRQRENLDLDGFALTDEEVAAISGLARADGRRFAGDPDTHEEL